jgi:hypothetical protein
MIKNYLKSKQVVALLILLLVALVALVAFIVRPRTQDKQVKGVEDRQGTTVEYKEGRITKKVFGGLGREDTYTNSFLPNFTIKDNTYKSWEVTESILNDKDGIFNANMIFKSGDINIIFSIINNNKTLENGKTCLVVDDISKINETWTREKMIDVSGQQTGYLYMKNSTYIPTTAPEFDDVYNEYVTYQKQLNLTAKEKSIITTCSTASRMNYINYKGNDGQERKGLARIFYNKGNVEFTSEEFQRIDNFITNTTL